MTVLVEVKTKPVVLDEDGNVLIVTLDIFSNLGLVFMEDSDKEGNIVGRLIVDDVEVVLEGIVELVIEESVKLLTILLELFVALIIVKVLI